MRKKHITLPLFLSQKEVENLLKNTRNKRHHMGFALMAYGGLRVSELITLKISQINLSKAFIKIRGKGDKERIVPLPLKLQNHIEKYLQQKANKLSYESPIVGGCRSAWHVAVKKAGKRILGRDDLHCHTLRHSFATALYEKGVPIEKIAEILGHNSIETTLIYSHISLASKHEAVQTLDKPQSKIFSFFKKSRKTEMSVKYADELVGREGELNQIQELIEKKKSFILSGVPGCGKSTLLRQIKDVIYVPEYARKKSLVYMLLASSGDADNPELKQELFKTKVDDLIEAIQELGKTIIIDDVGECSKADKKVLKEISKGNVLISASSKLSDRKIFDTYIEIKPLKRHHTRMILSEMIHTVDQQKKEHIVNDILHSAGENLKEAEYIARQMQLGKSTDEIVTPERYSNQVSIAPVLLMILLFFFSYVVKSYTSSMLAFSYALIVVFRFVFYRLIISRTMSRRRAT
jgi:energy-coupling factor transporter ATP-binding protein EcfA2